MRLGIAGRWQLLLLLLMLMLLVLMLMLLLVWVVAVWKRRKRLLGPAGVLGQSQLVQPPPRTTGQTRATIARSSPNPAAIAPGATIVSGAIAPAA